MPRLQFGLQLGYVQQATDGCFTLAGVAQWTECQPAKQKITGLIPSQGTCLGCGPGPQMGMYRRQPTDLSLTHQIFFLSFSLHSPISKNKLIFLKKENQVEQQFSIFFL